ncbi:MAG: NADH-quinone oxidoreductase subunit NuoG [Nitrospiraceae bacterium]|nr:MAG: NADH-quinone oxidoreductase subunit NuoG [Nitrospiraceae bacterium]
MATIFIDNKPYEVKEGQDLLQACLSLGFNVPYFCWHPAMHSVGACRQCAVKQYKDEADTRGKIVMSCMTPAADGTRISIDDPEAKAFRKGVIEWLMLNHPHDCPVCDEGGECHLQDMTVMTGHSYRRYRFKKRTYRNQYLGPFVNHEMDRCIQCYRCVRFYRDYAGGRDLNVFASHDHVYFGRHEDGILQSEFSGNLVEVCPTGVFTDKTLKKHYTRKWDLQTAPSVCVHCSLGCNTIPGERYGKLRRVSDRYNSEVNGYFLCDRGRFGYEFVNSGRRIPQVLVRPERNVDAIPVSREEVLEHISGVLHFGARVIGIGSPRASLEANFALRSLVGPENYYSGMSEKEHALISSIIKILEKGPARSASLNDVMKSDAVFVLGEDVLNTAPMLGLALRQSVRQRPMEAERRLKIPDWHDAAVRAAMQSERGPLFIATPAGTGIDDIAAGTFRGAPDDIARLGFAVAHELNNELPEVTGLSSKVHGLAKRIADELRNAGRPLIVSGTGCLSEAVIHAAANIAWALCEKGRKAQLCFAMPECNSVGLGFIGGSSIGMALKAADEGRVDAAIVLENDLYRRVDAAQLDRFFDKVKNVIVIDHVFTKTSAKADVILPAGSFAETTGTVINNEGRAQRFYQVFIPGLDIQESRQWLRDMMAASHIPLAGQWKTLDDITAAMTEAIPSLKQVREIAPGATYRETGMRVPRQPHRYSGRTAMFSHFLVHEPKPPEDTDAPFSFSMEGYEGRHPSPLIPRFWSPGWNSVQAVNKFQREINGPLRGGDTGKRLIEPGDIERPAYFTVVPAAFNVHDNEILVVPLYHIFGSEELSVISPGVAELSSKPYLALNPRGLKGTGTKEGEEIKLILNGRTYNLPVKFMSDLPDGVAGLPFGLPGSQWVELPAWGRVNPENADIVQ